MSKLVPVIVTVFPTEAVVGVPVPVVKLVMVGLAVELTAKGTTAEAVPEGAVTDIIPVVAPEGTVTVIDVEVTADGVAVVPLNETVVLAVVPKAVPAIVTVPPIGAALGDA